MTGPTNKKLASPVDLPALTARGARLLKEVGGSFALIGGVALQAYGHERYTKDVDFAVREAQGAAAQAAWKGETKPLRIGGVSLVTDVAPIDLIDRRVELRALYEEAIDATQRSGFTIEAAGEQVPVVPIEYLVAMKLAAPRAQDEADLAFLLKRRELDYVRARQIVRQHLGFGVLRFLDRLAREAGRKDAPRDYDEDEEE